MRIIAPGPLTTPRLRSGLAVVPRIAGMTVAFVGVTVLTGWLLDIGWLTGLRPNLATMKPNTALAFLLASALAYFCGSLLTSGQGQTRGGDPFSRWRPTRDYTGVGYVGASACAIIADSRVLKPSASALQNAITR